MQNSIAELDSISRISAEGVAMDAIDLVQTVQNFERELALELSALVQKKVDSLAQQTGLDIGEIAIRLDRAAEAGVNHYAVRDVTIEHGLPGRLGYY